MNKTVCIVGLGYQGKQYIEYFLKHNYNIVGLCNTKKTQDRVQNKYKIKVYRDYKKCLNNSIDLLVLCPYPLDINKIIIEYSTIFNYKILSDLPITFDKNLLKSYGVNKNIYFMLMETKLSFFSKVFTKNIHKIKNINCIVLQNKENLKNQLFKRESVIVDTQYVYNNILGVSFDKIKTQYTFINREIKNIEYIIEIFLENNEKIFYKYEEGRGIIYFIDNNGAIGNKFTERIIFDDILTKILLDIKNEDRSYIGEYIKSFNYILTKHKYEINS